MRVGEVGYADYGFKILSVIGVRVFIRDRPPIHEWEIKAALVSSM